MPTDILIYMIVAAVMVFWLRNVIGTKHGEERERPNPYDQKADIVVDSLPLAEPKTGNENADAGLVQIALVDHNFDTKQFTENASDAFTMIVTAFADADRDLLKDLCSDDVYRAFDDAIVEREKKGETVSTEIHAVRKARPRHRNDRQMDIFKKC